MKYPCYLLACASSLALGHAAALAQDAETAIVLDQIVVDAAHAWDPNAGAADRAETIYVDPEDLERRDPQTLKDVFAADASVTVGGALPAAQKVYVNGIEETNMAVTVDGARRNQKIFHHTSTNLIDPGLLKAVRVDPGVAAADAGPGALAGAIAYETVDVDDLLDPGRNRGGFETLRYGSNGDTFIGGLAAFGRTGGFEGLAYARYGTGHNYVNGDGETVDGTGTDLLSLLAKGAWQSETGHRFELAASQVEDDADRPFRANIGSIAGDTNAEVREYDLTSRNVVFSYEAMHASGIWQPSAQLAWTGSTTDVPDPYGSEGAAEGWNGKIENLFGLGPLGTITAGLDFYNEHSSYTDPWTPEISEQARNTGLYAQARLSPVAPLRISFGLRGDRQRFEGIDGSKTTSTGLSGNAFVEYDVNEILSVNAGYSNVFGGIQLGEPFIYNPAWEYDDIEPARSENMNAGMSILHRGFSFDAALFRTEIDNARDMDYTAGAYIPFDFRSEGYRLGAGYAWSTGFVRASFVDADVTSDGDPVDTFTLNYFGAPTGRVIALEVAQDIARYDLTIGGTLDAALDYDALTDIGHDEIDGYTVVNLYADYQPRHLEQLTLRLEVNNLFDETYADRATYGQEYGEVTPLWEPGREIAVAARWVF